jgi:ribosome hibernation promoting factor
MKVRIQGQPGQRLPRAHITSRLTHVLERAPFESLSTTVTFADLNGPRGGDDIRCTFVVDLPHTPSIRVEGRGPTPRLAFDVGYDRLVRRLGRSRERWRDQRRHPKKYFAAKRAQ